MNIMVVGGAGYIGSHMVRMLAEQGHSVVVFDDLSTGFRQAVTAGELIVGELLDQDLVEQVIGDFQVDAVMHFAACALVGESVAKPAKYYRNNVAATVSLLNAMLRCDVKRLVFSSTCATYGVPKKLPITESTPQVPVNPYGRSKLMVEQILDDYAAAYDFSFAALRYFNAAGASSQGGIGEDHSPETHLIPIVLQVALGQRESISIYGNDWDTPDGTCVRDFVHVDDLCQAHLQALNRLDTGRRLKINLGTGHGFSVKQIIETCREVTQIDIPAVVSERRAGDPPMLVADATFAREILGWEPVYQTPQEIIETAWAWHVTNPKGYGSIALPTNSVGKTAWRKSA